MDLRQLRYFTTLAQERNFTRAAEVLNMAQPPLSRQISLLEDELGVTLVNRSSRPVTLTEAGRIFHEQALQILGRVDQMREATRRVGLNQNRVLSIGFVASTLYGGLPRLVRQIRNHVPDLDIRLLEMISIQQVAALKEGRIDIGFGRLRHSDPAVTATVLREEPLVAAIPSGTALAREDGPLPIAALSGQRLIVYPVAPRPSYADQVLALLQRHGVSPEEVQEVREIQAALGLVAADAGVCLIPASARQMRADVQFRQIAERDATSPVIFNRRAGDRSDLVGLVERLTAGMQDQGNVSRNSA